VSLYWDDFERRAIETVDSIKNNKEFIVRRVAVFITNQCNFRCAYCNMKFGHEEMSKEIFLNILKKYGKTAIIHVTGGEPSTVSWLYPVIEEYKDIRFHLNTNGYLKPPENIKRLKVSLDTYDAGYFNKLVHMDVFNKVYGHIKQACNKTVTSITCVLTKENYEKAPEFIKFCNKEFPGLYAIFFSIYKGTNSRFVFQKEDIDRFYKDIKPQMEIEMKEETLWLFQNTMDNKIRLLEGIRFPENNLETPCYLSLTERVIDYQGNEYSCSHLFRDKVFRNNSEKHEKCRYGCNRKLIKFNEEVEKLLKEAK